jgi:hypothetical protein
MRTISAVSFALVLVAASPVRSDEKPAQPAGTEAPAADRVLIVDSEQLVFRASKESGLKMLSDLDREEAETIMRINRTRGTWQSYLLYTTPEMKVPAILPGFTITLPPPSRKELERRRQAAEGPAAGEPTAAPATPVAPR